MPAAAANAAVPRAVRDCKAERAGPQASGCRAAAFLGGSAQGVLRAAAARARARVRRAAARIRPRRWGEGDRRGAAIAVAVTRAAADGLGAILWGCWAIYLEVVRVSHGCCAR